MVTENSGGMLQHDLEEASRSQRRQNETERESRTAAMDAGATVYLTKPFLPQVLAEHAAELFGGTHGRQEKAVGKS